MFEHGARAKRGYQYHLPMNHAVEYSEKEYKIDPYVMGAFLGDGCKNQNGEFMLSSSDDEVMQELSKLLEAYGYITNDKNYKVIFYDGVIFGDKKKHIRIKEKDENYVELLSQLYCHEKYIPEEYKYGSEEQRWALIQGLMDTDGNIDIHSQNGLMRYNLSFSTTSERLRDDFIEVLHSLGCSSRYFCNKKAGKGNAKRDQFNISINVPNDIKHKFFRLSRKKNVALEAASVLKRKDYSRIAIMNIEKMNYQCEQVCFTVDNDEHLFLVGDYVVTHNTMVATLPLYLNALEEKGAFLVTVNDYLAKRDSAWMGKVYNYLGLSVGLIVHEKTPEERQNEYKCDITYGTNNEIGFDYLRDNMVHDITERVQRGFNYAIVDEVDSILIDEARTPLIISGFRDDTTEGYQKADDFVRRLRGKTIVEEESLSKLELATGGAEYVDNYEDYDYVVEEKKKVVSLTPRGVSKAEKYYGVENLSDPDNVDINHYITRSLKAHGIFKKDVDYVVSDGKIVIVDESTGRLMEGRRYAEGIHQAIEAKEHVDVQRESKSLAMITFQNLFRKFKKLAGMTGTALTEEEEFRGIYGLDVVEVPTNKPVIRIDKTDKVYIKRAEKLKAIVETVKKCQEIGQPVLVGTVSVEKSEELSALFKRSGIKHQVLNAKYHEKEAKIIAQAGKLGAVTIATNMAGRGTDIILGGNPDYLAIEDLRKKGYEEDLINEADSYAETDVQEILDIREEYKELVAKHKAKLAPEAEKVREAGGLYILGTERHESRRIDNQLRGRAGRQGDPGVSEFVLSLEDDLMRLFGGDKLLNMISVLNLPEDIPIDAKILSNSIEKAQLRVESKYFDIRKSVLQYDEVLAKQRDIVYDTRSQIISGEVKYIELAEKMVYEIIDTLVDSSLINKRELTEDDISNVKHAYEELGDLITVPDYDDDITIASLKENIKSQVTEKIEYLKSTVTPDTMEDYLKRLILFFLDHAWQDHMVAFDDLKQGIHLRAYAQQDPIVIFKLECFEMFDSMMNYVREEVLKSMMNSAIALKAGEEKKGA